VTTSPREAAELLARHGLAPRRSLGQNFVVDPNTVRRIARLAGVGPGDRVVEIGAGLGALTEALADTGAAVTAVEVDHGLMAVLAERLSGRGVRLVEGDARRLDWPAVLGAEGGWVLVANLPYNVATPLVADLLDGVPAVERMLVMVQREVGERLAAAPGDDGYGAVSVKVAYWATARVVGRVPPTVFLPRPKVESALVAITRRPEPAVGPEVDRDGLFALVRAGFGQRRKMLRRSLAALVEPEDFDAAGIRPDARAEELDVTDWGRLAAVVQAR
jgi:16S rRNA (adenine1518-N6/adenine1519-N6)-dimethyltransferase